MRLDTALDEFGLLMRRRHRGEEGRRTALALAAFREYLVDHSGYEDTERLSPDDLYNFLLEYYPSQEEPDPEVGLALLETAAGFAGWLVERGERGLAPFARSAERLRDDLPRVLEAMLLLQEHTRRDDIGEAVEVAEEDAESPVGTLSSGLERTVRLDQVDYDAAQMDYFTIQPGIRVEGPEGFLALRSASRDVLGEGAASPVRIPGAAAERLRPGDIFYAEIGPTPAGWEVLEVFGIRPGGYA